MLYACNLKFVRPMQAENAPARNIHLSEQAGQAIQASADVTHDPVLREALQRLALHAKKP